MKLAFVCALVLVVMGMSATQTQATDWVVGGLTQRWNFLHAEDVKTWYNTDWAANNTFKTGDNLSMSPHFPSLTNLHLPQSLSSFRSFIGRSQCKMGEIGKETKNGLLSVVWSLVHLTRSSTCRLACRGNVTQVSR